MRHCHHGVPSGMPFVSQRSIPSTQVAITNWASSSPAVAGGRLILSMEGSLKTHNLDDGATRFMVYRIGSSFGASERFAPRQIDRLQISTGCADRDRAGTPATFRPSRLATRSVPAAGGDPDPPIVIPPPAFWASLVDGGARDHGTHAMAHATAWTTQKRTPARPNVIPWRLPCGGGTRIGLSVSRYVEGWPARHAARL